MYDRTRFTLHDGLDLAGLRAEQLWWHYSAIGGRDDANTLAQRINGELPCDAEEHDLIAQALNEVFLDQGTATFPVAYSDELAGRLTLQAAAYATVTTRAAHARHQSLVARLRGAAAAQRAAELHATAAELMRSSGQLHLARHASERAEAAQQRSERAAAL